MFHVLSLVGDALELLGTTCCAHTRHFDRLAHQLVCKKTCCSKPIFVPTWSRSFLAVQNPPKVHKLAEVKFGVFSVSTAFERATGFVDEHESASTRLLHRLLLSSLAPSRQGSELSSDSTSTLAGRVQMSTGNGLSPVILPSSLWTFVTRDMICLAQISARVRHVLPHYPTDAKRGQLLDLE